MTKFNENLHIEESQQTSSTKKMKKMILRLVIIKLFQNGERDKSLKAHR